MLTVKGHLLRYGFVPGYYVWKLHGENELGDSLDQNVGEMSENIGEFEHGESSNAYQRMVFDVAGPEFDPNVMDEPPNPAAQHFFNMLSAADAEAWPGCETHL